MTTLYQCTIFISLTLLAVLTAIFIFAVTIYRGALEFSAKQEEDTLNIRKGLINRRREEISRGLKDVDDSTFPKQLRAKLDMLDAELNKIDQSILKSGNSVKALTARNLVAIPASFLLVSIIISGIAIATSGVLPTVMWVLSLVLLVAGAYFIYRNLSTVEFFSGVIDLSTLMEQALEKHAQKKSPIVDLEIWNPELSIPRGQILEIHYDVSLKQGTIAKNARVRFSGTEELDFPEEKVKQADLEYEYENMRNPKEFWQGYEDVNPKVYKKGKFKLKAPDQLGEYTMAYWIQCDEYTANQIYFKIRVI